MAAGHRVTALDLPGHGADPTPAEAVDLDACVAAVERAGRACGTRRCWWATAFPVAW